MRAALHLPSSSAAERGGRIVDAGLVRRLLRISRLCALLVTATGLLGLVGWGADIAINGFLKGVRP